MLLLGNITFFSADTASKSVRNPSTIHSSEIEVQKNGRIKVDGKYIKEKVSILDDFEEVRLPVLEKPETYIDKATFTLILPKNIAKQTDHEILGIHGVGTTNSSISGDNKIIYEARKISPYGVVSVIAKMPKGTIEQGFFDRFSIGAVYQSRYWLYIGLLLPILVFLIVLLITSSWFSKQKLPKITDEKNTLPMALPPAVVGALFRQKVTSREIAATLIDLAIRDNIIILDRERNFGFGKNNPSQMLSYENILLSKIFKKNIFSDKEEIERRINNHLYSKKISLVSSGIYEIATRLGFFKANLTGYHRKLKLILVIGSLITLIGFGFSLVALENSLSFVFFWLGLLASIVIFYLLAGRIPARTDQGTAALIEWIKFKNYLTNAEKIAFSYENQNIFEKFLPYAIVLECEVAWARRFSEQQFAMPDWFVTDKGSLTLEDFCLSLFPIISYVGQSFASIREPGFE